MSSTFGDSTMGLTYRRVQVVGVNEDGTEVQVADSTGWRTHLDGTVRPKGTGLPTEGEVWLIERLDATHWILRAQIASAEVDLGSEVNSIIAAEVAQQLAAEAAEDAERASQEAALAAGIMDGTGVVLIQDAAPGTEHENASTLWIDTTNDLNRPMRWSGDQWVVVVDQTAMEAARAAVEARDAAQSAADLAQSAKDTADAAKDAADAAVLEAEAALLEAAGKGRIIYGDPLTTPGESNSLLIGPGNILYYWDGQAWVEATHEQLFLLRDELDDLVLQVDANITDLGEVQAELVGVVGQIDGKSTIWPIGSSPDLGMDDTGDLRLMVDGGVEYWDGDEWLPADPRVAAAVNEAAEALGLANTKSTTYYKATEPINAQRPAGDIEAPETAFSTNDLWLRTGDNRLHRWDGEAWLEVRDSSISVIEGQVSDLGQSLTGLEGRVDGKSTIYIQDTAPVDVAGTEDIGDLWIDTAGGGRVYKVWDGEEWVLSDDPRVAEVLDQVSRKITTYYGSTEPTGTVQYPLVEGDLWLRSPDNRTFRYNGADWVEVSDSRIHATEQTLATVQGELIEMNGRIDGKAVVWYQDTDPSAGATPAWDIAQKGDIWIDISDPGAILYKVWDSNSWETITDPAALAALAQVETKIVTYFAAGTTTPTGAGFPPAEGYTTGDLWIRASDSRMFRFDGANWVDSTYIDPEIAAHSSAIQTLQEDYSTLSGTVDGKAVVYVQDDDPRGTDTWGTDQKGDIWIDTTGGTTAYKVWSGSTWTTITDPTAIQALEGLDSKTTTYYATGTTSPTGESGPFVTGDLWVHTTTNQMFRYDGANWVDVTYLDSRIDDAVTQYVVQYAVGSSETVAPTTGWSTATPTRTPGSYIWFRALVTYADGDTAPTSPALLTGPAGETGATLYTWVKYAPNGDPTSAQMSESPEGMTHMGIAPNQATPTEGTDPSVYTWSLIKGADGTAGTGISSTTVEYQVGSSGTTAPTGTWVETVPATSPGQYLWTRTTTTFTDASTTTAYSVSVHGSTGTAGRGVSGTEVTYQTGSSGTVTPTGTWEADPTPTAPGQYLWTRTVTTYTDDSTSTAYAVAAHGQDGTDGSDGVGITGTTVTYQVGSSGTSEPTGSWSSTIPATSPGQYLWTRTVTSYTDDSTSTAYAVAKHGTTGAAGVGVSGTQVRYQVGTSGTSEPTGTWLTDPPATSPGQYLWTRTITSYTDSSTSTAYAVAAHGIDGINGDDGVGIESTAVTYQVSDSGTTPPTGTWVEDPPATNPGQYLWSRTLITYTDDTTSTVYSVGAHGKDGLDAPVISLAATAQVLTAPATGGATTPTSASVVATAANTTITSWTYSVNGGSWSSTVPAGVSRSGSAVTVTGSTMTARTVAIKAADASGVSDTLTVAKVSDGAVGGDGADAYTVLLTNEAHTFAGSVSAAVAGSVKTTVLVYKGSTPQSVDITGITGQVTGLSASVDSGTDNTTSPDITVAATTSLTATSGTLTISFTADGQSFSKNFSWSVSRTGAKGDTGVSVSSVTPYYRQQPAADPAPAKPTGSTPTGWSTTEPAYAANTALYRTERVVYSNDSVAYTTVVKVSAYSGIVDLQTQYADLDGRVDGRTTIYYQDNAPTGLGTEDKGDIWVDSNASPKTYKVWSGGGWVDVTDTTAIEALGKVNTKITTYYATGTSAPSVTPISGGFVEGDLWVHTTTKALRRYDGSSWVDITDARLSNADNVIGAYQGTLTELSGRVDGRATVYYQDTDPKTASWGSDETGDIWIDTSGTTTVYKVYDGQDWEVITDPVATQALSTVTTKVTTYYKATTPITSDIKAPETAFREGDLWIRTTDNRLHRRDASGNWVEVSDTRISALATSLATTQGELTTLEGRVDGKANVYYGGTKPTTDADGNPLSSNDQGDIWIDTSGGQTRYYVWPGTGDWTLITDPKAQAALSGLDGKVTTYYATEKTGPAPSITTPSGGFTTGDLWVNQSKGNAIYRYPGSGTAWTLLALGKEAISATARDLGGLEIVASTDAPASPKVGDLWIDLNGNRLKRWDGIGWVEYRDPGIQGAIDAAVAAQGTADAKVRVFTQTTAPTGLLADDVGDIWVNTSEDNRIYVWELADAEVQVEAADAINHAANPYAIDGGSSWASYSSGGADTMRSATGGRALGFSTETYAQAASRAAGTIGLRVWAHAVGVHGKTVNASITVRSTSAGTITFQAKFRQTATGTLVNGPSTSVAVAANTTTTLTLSNVAVPGEGYDDVTFWVGHNHSPVAGTIVRGSDFAVSEAPATPVLFSGDTPDTTSYQYAWNGTPLRSASTRRPLTNIPAGYRWVPRPPGTNAFKPGSIEADKVVKSGTVTAELFEAVLVLSSKFVAGDPTGAAAELTETGLQVFIADQDTGERLPVPMLDLGSHGDQALAVTDGLSNTPTASLSAQGDVSGLSGNFRGDIAINGQNLIGAWASRDIDAAGDRDSVLWNMPWGIVGDAVNVGVLAGHLRPAAGVEQMLVYGDWRLIAGRQYRVTWDPIRVRASNLGDNPRIVTFLRTEYSPEGMPPVPTTSSNQAAYGRNPYSQLGQFLPPLKVHIRPGSTVWQRFAVSIKGENCTPWVLDEYPTGEMNQLLYVEDMGPRLDYENGVVYGATSTPLRKYTYYFRPTYTQMKQLNYDSYFSYNGVNQQSAQNLMQGRHSVYDTGVYRTLMDFSNAKSSSGSTVAGVSVSSAMSGAVKGDARIRTTLAWSPRSSVKPRFGWQIGWNFSSNTSPASQVTGASVSPGGSTVTNLGGAFFDWLKTNRTNSDWRLFLGPGSHTSNVDAGLFYGLGGASTQDVRLELVVYK